TPDGPEKAYNQRLMGQLVYDQALRLIANEDQDSQSQAEDLLKTSQDDLRQGLDGMTVATPEAMQAALTLAKVHRRQGKPADAISVLDSKEYGPLTLVGKLDPPSASFKLDLYSTELQSIVDAMVAGEGDLDKLLSRSSKAVANLNASANNPGAKAKLGNIFINIARKVEQAIDEAGPAKKQKLIEAFRVFLSELVRATKDPVTLQWVGERLMNLAEASMPPGQAQAVGQSKDLLDLAVKTFGDLQGKVKGDRKLALEMQLARANRLTGNYAAAINTLAEILKEKPTMLDAQIEAALSYEQWAGKLDPKIAVRAYKSAIMGGRPDANKKNIIWGWGRISQTINGRPQYRTQFFDARYHLALCRYLSGKKGNDKDAMKKAIRDIEMLETVYPDMGGKQQKAKFDALKKQIQKEAS
ncbi:MAG: hypothetical protein AAGA03_11580, partial [Planctomycetota bacterium]